MTEANDRRVLEQYAAANAALDEAPSEQTRAAILAAAARAAGARPRPVGWSRRWRVPLAAAAGVMVGAMALLLATHVDEQAPETQAPQPMSATPISPPPAEEARSRADSAAPAAPAAETRPSAPAQRIRRQAEPPPMPSPDGSALGKVSPAPAAPPPAAESLSMDKAAPPAEPSAAAASAAGRRAEQENFKPKFAAEALRDRDAPWRESTQAWIERIAKLRQEGRNEEAERELALFRARHPDVQLPPAALPSPGP